MEIAVINVIGAQRVLDGKSGMTFIVDSFSYRLGSDERIAHVRDYRHRQSVDQEFQIWSISSEGYTIIEK